MDKQEITLKLKQAHSDLTQMILSLPDNEFIHAANGKWSAAQQLDHIYKSVSAVNTGVALPKLFLRILIGKANRPSRSYDELVAKYQSKLGAGGKAPRRFIPKHIDPSEKKALVSKLESAVAAVCKHVLTYSESQLDHYILPHPLLGKITVREMLYFTIYHAPHHQAAILRGLGR